MDSEYKFMASFRGYPNWDEETQKQALLMVYGFYVDNYGDDNLIEYLEEDLAIYEMRQEFEICIILKELIYLAYDL